MLAACKFHVHVQTSLSEVPNCAFDTPSFDIENQHASTARFTGYWRLLAENVLLQRYAKMSFGTHGAKEFMSVEMRLEYLTIIKAKRGWNGWMRIRFVTFGRRMMQLSHITPDTAQIRMTCHPAETSMMLL